MVHLSPSWNGLHAIIVHFPIVLLLIAPLFVIVGLALRSAKGRPFLMSALAFMMLGTATIFIAAATGEVVMKAVGSAPAVRVALEQHRGLAGTTHELFAMLTVSFAAMLFVPRLLGHELESWVSTALLAVFLVFYATGALFLVNTVHHGGLLVHQLGHNAAATVSVPIEELRQ
jgi:uncharacterized membrane protein